MKKHRHHYLSSLFIGALFTIGSLQAATVTAPAAGDLFLGVRLPGGGTSYLINIGNDSTFRNAAPGTPVTLDNIGADLADTFGSDWATNTALQWSIFGSRNQANPVVYGSRAETTYGSSASGFAALNLIGRTNTNTQIISVVTGYSLLDATANNAKAAKQANSAVAASYAYQVGAEGTTDFGALSGWTNIEGAFANGPARTALDLFRYSGNTTTGVDSVERLGALTISSGGALSFLPGPVINSVQVVNATVSVREDAGSATVNFERLGDGNANAITATFSLTDGTALAGTDFTTPGSLTVSFAANASTSSVVIPITNRTGFHGTRGFTLTLVSASGGYVVGSSSSSALTITDADPDPGSLAFVGSSISASVTDTSVTINLERTGGSIGAVSVDVSATGGTLTNGAGYTFASPTTVTFADGANTASTSLTLSTSVSGTIALTLTNPTNFSRLGSQTTTTINVAGNPGVLAFESANYSFPESAGSINIPIKRTVGVQGSVSVTVNTGAAGDSAAAPSDYSALVGYTATLAEGETSVNVPISLFDTIANEANETFTITLSSPTGGATLGPISTTKVRIEEYDTKAPTVALTSPSTPAANARVTSAAVTVAGSFSDDKGVDHVEVSLNGGAPVNATLIGSATSGTFTLNIAAAAGTNTITVQSVDASGNVSPIVSRAFTYVVSSSLTVNIDAASPANSGTLSASFPLTATFPQNVSLEVGKTYTITAKPSATFVFAGWTGAGISAAAAEVPALTFVHKAGLTLTAKFIANPFASGEFSGLIKALVPANASVGTEGSFYLNVTGTGTFTGTAKVDGLSQSLTGSLNTSGAARFGATRAPSLVIPRVGKPSLVLAFALDLAPAGTVTGTLGEEFRSATTPLSSFTADRSAYGASLAPAASLQGLHTAAVLPLAQTNGLTTADYPQGNGVGGITVSAKGVASLVGTLADGTAITASAPLSKPSATSHKAPLFAQLYANKGALGVTVSFDTTLPNAVLSSTDVLWFKPYVAGQYYPFGWLEGVSAKLVGAKYDPAPAGASVVPGLPAVNNVTGNATLTFANGKLSSTLTKNVSISATNLVTKVPATNPTYALTITAKTGDIGGSFIHSDGTAPKFFGKIIQKGPDAGTYGYFLSTAPKVADGTGQSGGVTLLHK